MQPPDAHHVGLTVADIEAAEAFYNEVLDFPVLDRFLVDGEAFATGVGVDGAAGQFVHLDAGTVRLELVTYAPEGEAQTSDINQPGAAHVGFEVADLDAVYDDLPDDVATLSAPQTTASGTRILFLRDPEGNLVELLEV
jgi:catechol 2,3-dioxygenase-like lactoylglutathione lyase family enzyme